MTDIAPPPYPNDPEVGAPAVTSSVEAPVVAPAPTTAAGPGATTAPPTPPPARPTAESALGGHLTAERVSAWFGGRKVLEQCSLDMPPHKVTALIGPSGCGKSTFLRTLNRMHELIPGAEFGGSILLDGEDIYSPDASPPSVRNRIGMVFQKPNPFPAMSIRDNVLAGLKLTGSRAADADALVEASLRGAGLWDEVKDRLNDGGMGLSGGQQQRLCIARALAVKPSVLLMDEPCSALDPISTRVIEETIRELSHEVTIVIVTHNMQQAQRVSDQCAFFLVEEFGQPGRIYEAGDTEQIFNAPKLDRTLAYVTGQFG